VTLPVVWLPEADADAKAARSWYGAVRSELGEQFAWAIYAAVEAIRQTPRRFTIIGGAQACGAFPYGPHEAQLPQLLQTFAPSAPLPLRSLPFFPPPS
jgi:hypothetical protein